MLGERVFKIIMNIICVVLLYSILLGPDCDFLDTWIGGRTKHPLYFYNHPCQKVPLRLDDFYVFKLSYHCYELLHTLILDRKRTDFLEYALHHFLTFSLILFSYVLNYLPVGASVMILHDMTDLGASIFKLTIDVTPFFIQMCGYSTMLVSWIYFRLWFFPMKVIGRIIEESQNWHGSAINLNFIAMLTCFLIILFFMHIFWFYLMIKGLLRRLQMSNYKEQVSLANSENRSE